MIPHNTFNNPFFSIVSKSYCCKINAGVNRHAFSVYPFLNQVSLGLVWAKIDFSQHLFDGPVCVSVAFKLSDIVVGRMYICYSHLSIRALFVIKVHFWSFPHHVVTFTWVVLNNFILQSPSDISTAQVEFQLLKHGLSNICNCGLKYAFKLHSFLLFWHLSFLVTLWS